MKRRAWAIVVTFVALGLAAPADATDRDVEDTCATAADAGFADVSEANVHHRRIDCIRHYEITRGTSPTTFDPAGQLTRGQLASFLSRTLDAGGNPLPAATTDWFDDDNGSTHEAAINALAEAGIVPTTSRTYGIEVMPTRAEMSRLTGAALAWAGVLVEGGPPDFFVDDEHSPDETFINLLTDAGIVTGRGLGEFAPDELLRRDQMATFLARSIDAVQNGPGSHHHCRIHEPDRSRFDPFYSQQCEVFGIAVVASSNVDPAALLAAVDGIVLLLGQRPELHVQMGADGFYLIILGEEEGQTDPPEYADLRDDPDTDWDERARGLGGSEYASAGEENLLCRESDRYRGESIFLHELSHSVLSAGYDEIDPEFRLRVEAAYDAAMAEGKWQNTYAATDHDEYWAEGVQSWLDANLEADPPNEIHNHVDTREELQEYDPGLYDLVAEGIGGTERYRCP